MATIQPASQGRLFNDEHARSNLAGPNHLSTFHLFPCLPKELRLRIWECSLQGRERLVRLCVSAQDLDNADCFPEGLMRPTYTVIADGYNLHSKLLRVSSEARAAALAFYRVPLPVIFAGDRFHRWHDTFHLTPSDSLLAEDGGGGPVLVDLNVNFHLPSVFPRDTPQATAPCGVLHINPESDFIEIIFGREVRSQHSHIVHDFIQRFRTDHDPRGIGLRNLVVNNFFLTHFRPARRAIGEEPSSDDNDPQQEPDRGQPLDAAATRAFRETMAGLHEVFLSHVFHEGRTSCAPNAREGDPYVNESYPVMTLATHFSRAARDPRPTIDLTRVSMVTSRHPDEMLEKWKSLMASVGIAELDDDEARRLSRTEFHFLIAASPHREGPRVWPYDRRGGLSCMQREMDAFPPKCEERASEGNMPVGFAERLQATRAAERQQPPASPVLGFWLFPLGSIPPAAENRVDWPLEESVDLSGHWPALGVFDFSTEGT